MARRAAEIVAVRNLARKLGLGRRSFLRGFRYHDPVYKDDGSVVVVVEYRVRRDRRTHAARPPSARSARKP